MHVVNLKLEGALLLEQNIYSDRRGSFSETYNKKEFSRIVGKEVNFVQDNYSISKKNVLRGLHFQRPPKSEVKLVRCIKGEIWDVVVDLRKKSDTCGKWFGAKLSEGNQKMMYIPKGFAHGFMSLKSETEIIYFVSDFYSPESEETLIWNDNDVSINWPMDPIIISDKDLHGKNFKNIELI